MKNLEKTTLKSLIGISISVAFHGAIAVWLLTAGATSASAQGQVASGIISSLGAGPYTYNLSFTDAANATSPIGSVWYGWVPGGFFLPSMPTSASGPAGWTATISGNSIQFVANSPANDIAAGQTLSGFSYHATFSPSQLAAAPNGGLSVAYSGGLFSDTGNTFNVQSAPVPEPTPVTLLGVGVLLLVARQTNVLGTRRGRTH
jgi:hypothetical protein